MEMFDKIDLTDKKNVVDIGKSVIKYLTDNGIDLNVVTCPYSKSDEQSTFEFSNKSGFFLGIDISDREIRMIHMISMAEKVEEEFKNWLVGWFNKSLSRKVKSINAMRKAIYAIVDQYGVTGSVLSGCGSGLWVELDDEEGSYDVLISKREE